MSDKKEFTDTPNQVLPWISVKDKPLFTTDENGYWTVTEDGEGEFLAAVQYFEKGKKVWWIRLCVVKDGDGLCVICDDDVEIAGWELEDVEFYCPINEPENPGTTCT